MVLPLNIFLFFVDSFLKPLVPRISSYIHDTAFHPRILGIQHQVPSTAIIRAHLMCLPCSCTPIFPTCTPTFPMMKGLMHAPKLWPRVVILHPITDIVTLMNHVLTKNNFTFLDKQYLQVHGTAIDTRMAPSIYGLSVHGQTRGSTC